MHNIRIKSAFNIENRYISVFFYKYIAALNIYVIT